MKLLGLVPDTVRNRLDDWRFWNGVAFFGIACLVVWGVFVYGRTVNEEATRKATTAATATAAVRRCIEGIPVLVKVNRFFEGEREGWQTLVENSRANLKTTALNDPVRPVRVANLRRLEGAAAKVAAVDKFPVPTEDQCRTRGATQ